MIKKVLVPLDGSMRAEQALDLISQLFRTDEIEIILLESMDVAPVSVSPYYAGVRGVARPITETHKARNDAYIESVAQTTKSWAPNVSSYSVVGRAADRITELAETKDVDLIVMVTHGYAGFERMLFGSVTEEVIRNAPCPVLAIRDGHLPERMLIALDGTEFSEQILPLAFELAVRLRADVTLTRVDLPEEDVSLADLNDLRRTDPELANRLIITHNSRSEFYLDAIYQRYYQQLEAVGAKIDYDVDYGQPNKRLPKVAERHNCDLITLTTHGRKGLARLLKGSVTEDVMHRTQAAVLVLHPVNND